VKGEHSIREDFDERIDIIPVSDPNAGTMAQRIMQYQAALQLATQAPQMYDMPLLHRQMLEILGIQDAEKIVPTEEDLLPTDPVSENMNILNGKPVKAFMYQDHEAHIQAHMSSAQNPQMLELLEKNPKAKSIMGAMADHVTEHLALAYRDKIEKELGMHLPGQDEPLPEDIELRISRLVAPAAAQVTGKAQKQKQAEKNAEMQKDPIIQMQQKELEIKDRAQKAKEKEAQMRQQTEAKKSEDRKQTENAKVIAEMVIEYMRQQQKGRDTDKQIQSREAVEGFKIGVDLADRILEKSEENNDSGNGSGS